MRVPLREERTQYSLVRDLVASYRISRCNKMRILDERSPFILEVIFKFEEDVRYGGWLDQDTAPPLLKGGENPNPKA